VQSFLVKIYKEQTELRVFGAKGVANFETRCRWGTYRHAET